MKTSKKMILIVFFNFDKSMYIMNNQTKLSQRLLSSLVLVVALVLPFQLFAQDEH